MAGGEDGSIFTVEQYRNFKLTHYPTATAPVR